MCSRTPVPLCDWTKGNHAPCSFLMALFPCGFKDHYDWGLRAIKSVLVVAGSLKRSDRDRPEDQVLMRALRDFNIPKIVTDDVPVFMGLIGDLFPALDVPRKRDMDFEALVKKSALVSHSIHMSNYFQLGNTVAFWERCVGLLE